jgi:hypothetical protein
MLSVREFVNEGLSNTEPFKVVTGTLATAAALGVAYKIITSEEDMKQVIGRALFKAIRAVPGAEAKISKEKEKILLKIEEDLDVIKQQKFKSIPSKGLTHEETLAHMKACLVSLNLLFAPALSLLFSSSSSSHLPSSFSSSFFRITIVTGQEVESLVLFTVETQLTSNS